MRNTSEEFYQILRDDLKSAKYAVEDPLPTLREFETEYGLSKDTVSKVFAALEGEGLIARVGRRFFPVHRHRSEDRVIAIEHVYHRNEHPFYGALNDGIVDALLSSQYGIHLFTRRNPGGAMLSSGSVMSALLKHGVLRGVILFAGTSPEDVHVFKDHDVAVCTVYVKPAPGVILFDLEQAALQGTHYMANRGFDHIGIVYAQSIAGGIDVKGYQQALSLLELSHNDNDIIDCSEFFQYTVKEYIGRHIPYDVFLRERLKPIIEGAKQAVLRRIQAGNFPRALYIADEYMAIGVVRALQEAGLRIPQDVALVSNTSSDNWAIELNGLTTTQFNGYTCGMEAAQFVIDIAEGRRSADDCLTLQARLVKGMSCGELDDVNSDEVSLDKVM